MLGSKGICSQLDVVNYSAANAVPVILKYFIFYNDLVLKSNVYINNFGSERGSLTARN